MKNYLLRTSIVTLLLFAIEGNAQHFNIHNPITLPDKSQQSVVMQQIGYTQITINYHSPATKDRVIWGKMVPYGKIWRAGANENTVFTITDAVEIEGKKLAAGSYGLHLLPEEDQWTFIFSKDHTSWGSYFYNEQEDALRVKVPLQDVLEPREWMSFDFVKRDRDATSIVLSWANKRAELNLTLNVDEIALDNIRKQLRSDAYWEWFSWCQAADYCAEYKINTEEALGWIERSIELDENFSNWDVKAKLLKQLGDEDAAKEAIQRAIEVGDEIYLERYGRRFLNQKDFEQAEFIFRQALKKNDTYWRAHFNRANALKGLGKKKEAHKAFEAALANAPLDKKSEIQKSIRSAE